ncbi:MAG: hypothetical protein K8S00_11330 [Bacteroidales bacterium]|nr:hypothetical protein [Bacteroidales bacterium]
MLFSSIIQIVHNQNILKNKAGAIMLDPHRQQEVVSLWFKYQPQRESDYSKEVIEGFSNINWIFKHSEGIS